MLKDTLPWSCWTQCCPLCVPLGFPITEAQSRESFKAINRGNCRARPISFPSLKDHYPLLLMSSDSKTVALNYILVFVVVVSGRMVNRSLLFHLCGELLLKWNLEKYSMKSKHIIFTHKSN